MSLVKIGHAELAVDDLTKAREFYVDVLGFVLGESDGRRLYLRGVAETDHHSLVLTERPGPRLVHYAWRVSDPGDLESLSDRFRRQDRLVRRIPGGAEAGQGEAILVCDPCGHPVEFYHSMEKVKSLARRSHLWTGAAPQRFDHVALFTPDVGAATEYYRTLGLHLSEYVETEEGDATFAAFLHRTSHSHDVALIRKERAGLQHLSFWVENVAQVIRVADVVADAGHADRIEFGPGRHKATNSFFVYLRDPCGNRLEFYTEGYWVPDPDEPPIRWTYEEYLREGRLSFGGQAPESFFQPIPVEPVV